MKAEDIFYMQGIEKRAGKVVYKQHGINRHELTMLAGLAAYLQLHGKKSVSRRLYLDWIGVNYRLEIKCFGYISGLVRLGACHRLTYRNTTNGNSLAISPYGIRILDLYYKELDKISKQDKARKKLPGYKTLGVTEAPPGYKVEQLGRFE